MLAPELSSLIHKMAQKFTESALVSSSDCDKINNCSLHDGNQLVERTIMINTAEALHHFNIPNEIVKTLRASHIFLKDTGTSNLHFTKEDKAQKSINNFLKEFEAMVSNAAYIRRQYKTKSTKSKFIHHFILFLHTEHIYTRWFRKSVSIDQYGTGIDIIIQ